MSIYIHIPFCRQICFYCDFCKFYYNENWVLSYLEALEKEIDKRYDGREVKTIYIGGGTPSSLSISSLKKLFKIIEKINKKNCLEFTFECNTEDLTLEKILFLKENGVTRLSIGVQTFEKTVLKKINRNLDIDKLKNAFNYFDNINVDLMFALPNQNINSDLEKVLKLKPQHISVYNLIVEPNTIFYINKIKEIDDEKQREMYDNIVDILEKNGYIQYEISNFSIPSFESKHNLVYWNNEEYYGFGLGASGYVNKVRYENTRNFKKYLNLNFEKESLMLTKERVLEDEFMLGLRKINGISKEKFKKKYGFEINEIPLVKELIEKKLLLENEKNVFINRKFLYVSNEILEKFINTNLLIR